MDFYGFHKYIKNESITIWKKEKDAGESWNKRERKGIFGLENLNNPKHLNL